MRGAWADGAGKNDGDNEHAQAAHDCTDALRISAVGQAYAQTNEFNCLGSAVIYPSMLSSWSESNAIITSRHDLLHKNPSKSPASVRIYHSRTKLGCSGPRYYKRGNAVWVRGVAVSQHRPLQQAKPRTQHHRLPLGCIGVCREKYPQRRVLSYEDALTITTTASARAWRR